MNLEAMQEKKKKKTPGSTASGGLCLNIGIMWMNVLVLVRELPEKWVFGSD
jgi:hypothetical protein